MTVNIFDDHFVDCLIAATAAARNLLVVAISTATPVSLATFALKTEPLGHR